MRKASASFLIDGSYSFTEHSACTLSSSIFDIYTSTFESFANVHILASSLHFWIYILKL